MKAKFLFGMVALAATMAFSTAHAVVDDVAKAKTSKQMLIEYTAEVKKAEFGASMTAKGLDEAKLGSAKASMIDSLQLEAQEASKLSISLGHNPQRIELLATVAAAKKWAGQVSQKDPVEGKSLNDAATAAAKLLANASLTGSFEDSQELNPKELADTTAALTRTEALIEALLTHFNQAERNSWTQVLERQSAIIDARPGKPSEDAFVEAIMSVKGVDKATAMDLVRKIKECV